MSSWRRTIRSDLTLDGHLRSKHTFPRTGVAVDETRSVFVKSEICKNVRTTKGFLTQTAPRFIVGANRCPADEKSQIPVLLIVMESPPPDFSLTLEVDPRGRQTGVCFSLSRFSNDLLGEVACSSPAENFGHFSLKFRVRPPGRSSLRRIRGEGGDSAISFTARVLRGNKKRPKPRSEWAENQEMGSQKKSQFCVHRGEDSNPHRYRKNQPEKTPFLCPPASRCQKTKLSQHPTQS